MLFAGLCLASASAAPACTTLPCTNDGATTVATCDVKDYFPAKISPAKISSDHSEMFEVTYHKTYALPALRVLRAIARRTELF